VEAETWSLSESTGSVQRECASVSKQVFEQYRKQGLIKSFEFTHELAWNVIKDFFFYQGNSSIMGSRDASREAFSKGLIDDGSTWMKMSELAEDG